MDPLTIGLLAGAGLGLLKGQKNKKKDIEDAQTRKAMIMYSPWTGMSDPGKVEREDALSGAVSGAATGAMLGSAVQSSMAKSAAAEAAQKAAAEKAAPAVAAQAAPAQRPFGVNSLGGTPLYPQAPNPYFMPQYMYMQPQGMGSQPPF